MTTGGTTKEAVREALLDIQRYLADEIAPLMAVDAARVLLRMPPKFGAVAIEHWLEGQLSAPNRAVTVSSYLYHAVKKIHLFSEFKLIEPNTDLVGGLRGSGVGENEAQWETYDFGTYDSGRGIYIEKHLRNWKLTMLASAPADIELDRKVLAEMAITDPAAFARVARLAAEQL